MQPGTSRFDSSRIRSALVLSAALALIAVGLVFPAERASAAPCGTTDVTLQRISSSEMYIDTGISPQLTSAYAGYRIETSTTALADTWVRATNFGGGSIDLAANEDGLVHIGPLATFDTGFAYVYLTASGAATGQTHEIQIFDGHPDFGGSQVCTEVYGLSVDETIKANANKVTTVVSGPNPAQLGGIMTMTVTGQTGQVGDGPPGHPDGLGVFFATPATTPDWAADAYQLVDAEITFDTAGTFSDTLIVSGLNGTNQDYTAVYTFVAVGATTAPTAVSPVNYIASGTQIKHTDTGGFASLDPILPTENRLTLAKAVSPDTVDTSGQIVTYTVTLSNSGTVDATIDDFIDVLPAGSSYVSGSATFGGAAIPDPYISGQTIVFVGVFAAPAGGSADLTYQVEMPTVPGLAVNSVVGHVASTEIDTTLDTDSSDPATAAVTVGDPNDPPDAIDDSATTTEATSTPIDVANNDIDPEGNLDPSTTTVLSGPTNGGVVNNGDGTVTYTPDPGFVGMDTFTYRICDTDGACDSATVTVTVEESNEPPVANDDTRSTGEDSPVTMDLAANDTDPDGNLDPTTVTVLSGPSNGSVVNNGDGTVTYTPDSDYSGTDSFTYEVCDTDGLCDAATATVTVSAVPDSPIANDDAETTAEDTPATWDLSANDSDPDGDLDPTSVTILSGPSEGTLVNNGDGTITYTPGAHYNGPDTVVYEICDIGGRCDTATLSITVSAVADDPIATNDARTTPQDTNVDVTVVANDSDVDGDLDATSATTTVAPSNGSTIDNGDGTITYVPDSGFTGIDTFTYEVCDGQPVCVTAVVTIDVTPVDVPPVANPDTESTPEDTPATWDVAANDSDANGDLDPTSLTVLTQPMHGALVNNGDGTVTYTPNPEYSGPDSFTYEICDLNGSCDATTVSVTVTSVDDPPVARNDSASTPEDTPVDIDLAANDTDPDGDLDPTSITILSGPSNGSVIDNGDGTVTYTPDANYSGTDSFTYEICDLAGNCAVAAATVTAQVVAVDDPPVAVDDTLAATENTPVTWDVSANDTDPDGDLDSTTVAILSGPVHGTLVNNGDGTVTYSPDSGYDGPDSFVYEICDSTGACDTATGSITVAGTNDPPVAVDDARTTAENTPGTWSVVNNDSDPEGALDPASVSINTSASNGAAVANGDGTVTYTPDPGFVGVDTFDYEVCDTGGECATATVTVTVANVPEPPDAINDSETTPEDTPITFDPTSNDTDPDGDLDPTSVTILINPSGGTATVNPDGSITYTPDPDFSGGDSLVYEVCDATGSCDTATVALTVTPVNDPPTAGDDSVITAEDSPTTIDVVINDSDPEGALNSSSVSVVSGPSNGSVVVNPGGTIDYTPDPDFSGTDTFTYEVCDSTGACDTATVTVTVVGMDDPPIAGDDAASTDEDMPVDIPLISNDSDPDGDLVASSITVTAGPSNGTVTVTGGGVATYTPDADFSGTDTFSYEICDSTGACDSATVTITIADVNDPPVAEDDSVNSVEDAAVTIDVLADDRDPDGDLDPTSVQVVGGPEHGTVHVDPVTGAVTYTPDPDYSGADMFEYIICDDDGACDTATVTVSIQEVNETPTYVGEATLTAPPGTALPPLEFLEPDNDNYTVTVTGGQLPPGTDVLSDGTWSGFPTETGTFTFTVEVCDDATPPLCSTSQVTVVIGDLAQTGYSGARSAVVAVVLITIGTMLTLAVRPRDTLDT